MARRLLVGIEFPNCREGVFVPAGFATPEEIVDCVVLAERLGFHAAWATDFISPTPFFGVPEDEAPAWLEPMTVLAYAAARTSRIKLATGLLMAPYRDPVILAKEAATLDQLCGGRFWLGLGLGMARDEFERVRPRERKRHRGRMLDEQLELLRRFFGREREVTHDGEYYAVDRVSLNPKPAQSPLPIYVPVRKDETLERVVRYGLHMTCRAETVPVFLEKLEPLLEGGDRSIDDVDAVAEGEIVIGDDVDDAMARYAETRHGRFRLRRQPKEKFVADNWVGTTAQIVDKLGGLTERGVWHFNVLHLAADSLAERHELMHRIAEQVVSKLPREVG